MDIQENLLEWAMTASAEERLAFLRKYLQVIPSSELELVIKQVQGAKKRNRRNVIGNDKEKIQQLKKRLKTTDREKNQILEEIKACEKRRQDYQQSKLKGDESEVPQTAKAVSSEAQTVVSEEWRQFPMNRYVKGTCFEKYFPTNYVLIDCETVTLKNGDLECGSVAIVNHNQQTIYKSYVHHAANSFNFNEYTIKCNGFNFNSLANPKCPKLEEVTAKVEELVKNKLVVLIGGDNEKESSYNDLIALKLDLSNINIYNLHFHFFKTTY